MRALERRGRMVRPIAAAVSLLIAVAAAAGAVDGESPNTIFFRANALYGEQKYAEAAAEYEKILAGGQESGNLYFNLGNAYFKLGRLGPAIPSLSPSLPGPFGSPVASPWPAPSDSAGRGTRA